MIPTFKPSIVRKDMDSVLTCMVEETLSYGDTAKEFLKKTGLELSLQAAFGVKEYQRGFEALLKAAETVPGQRIALSPLVPSWYAQVIRSFGLNPVFLDVDPGTAGMVIPEDKAPEEIADIFLFYHHLGFENDLSRAEESGVTIIEDTTQLLASRLQAGKESVNAALGLYCMEEEGFLSGMGGTVVYAGKRKEAANLKKVFDEQLDISQFLTDPQAALASSQWARIDKFISRRNELRAIFTAALQKSRNRTFAVQDESLHVPYCFPVLLNSGAREVQAYARKKKVLCVPAFENSVLAKNPDLEGDLSGARSLLLRCLAFPLYPSLSSGDADTISKVLSTLP